MKNLKLFLVFVILSSNSIFAQTNINNYKYVIVPTQYEFQKSDDQYQVNSLTKFLFEKAGFQVFMGYKNFPDELKLNECLALTARLNDNSKMLSTKMNFDLVDCNNVVVFKAQEAKSKTKDYKQAYHECVRESFESIKALNYMFEPKEDQVQLTKTEKENPTKKSGVAEDKVEKSAVVPVVTTTAVVKTDTTNKSEVIDVVMEEPIMVTSNVLYAQPNANGYQVVDSTPKVIYVLLKTKVEDVYLVKGKSATVYKENGNWKLEFYENGKSVVKELNLKFF